MALRGVASKLSVEVIHRLGFLFVVMSTNLARARYLSELRTLCEGLNEEGA